MPSVSLQSHVACRHLGYLDAVDYDRRYSFAAPALANVTCAGNETTIQDCSFVQPPSSGCPNRQAMTVNCKGMFLCD